MDYLLSVGVMVGAAALLLIFEQLMDIKNILKDKLDKGGL